MIQTKTPLHFNPNAEIERTILSKTLQSVQGNLTSGKNFLVSSSCIAAPSIPSDDTELESLNWTWTNRTGLVD